MGKPSAVGVPTRPTQLFVLLGSINWVVSYFIGCVLVAPSGECLRSLAGAVDQPLCAVCCSSLSVLNLSVYNAAMLGSCCVLYGGCLCCSNCAVCQQLNKRRLLLLLTAHRAVACDGEVLNVECYDGDTIRIVSANYGRRDNVTCQTDDDSDKNVECVYRETRALVSDRHVLLGDIFVNDNYNCKCNCLFRLTVSITKTKVILRTTIVQERSNNWKWYQD